jgi:hypothetical protein
MSELTLFIFRIAFLILLWVFVFFVVYAVRSDLFGQRTKKMIGPTLSPASSAFLTQAHTAISDSSAPRPAQGSRLWLVITAGTKVGERLPLGDQDLTIGRSSDSSLVIRDDYTSTRHAVIQMRNGAWQITDLDSTNGTLVNGQRISGSVPLNLNVPIAIGQTVCEVQADA